MNNQVVRAVYVNDYRLPGRPKYCGVEILLQNGKRVLCMVEQAIKGPIGCYGVLASEFYTNEFQGGFYRYGKFAYDEPPSDTDECSFHGSCADLEEIVGKTIRYYKVMENNIQRAETDPNFVSVTFKIKFTDNTELYLTSFNYDGKYPLEYLRYWPNHREAGLLDLDVV